MSEGLGRYGKGFRIQIRRISGLQGVGDLGFQGFGVLGF